jgi:glycosyltransferase involved in cell wall biosynthesis
MTTRALACVFATSHRTVQLKEHHVATPVSLVLTVHNAEAGLQSRTEELLELMAELSEDFEMLIVDDGSTDSTEEVAHEVAREYPQMSVRRHAAQQGPLAAAETGMRHTQGEVVFVQDYHAPAQSSDLRRLWRQRHRHDLQIAQRPTGEGSAVPKLVDRLRASAVGMTTYTPLGLQMIRRAAADQWRREFCPPVDRSVRRRADSAGDRQGPKFSTRSGQFALGE